MATERIIVDAPEFKGIELHHMHKWVAVSKNTRQLIVAGDALSDVLSETASVKDKIVFKVLPQLLVG